MKMLVFKFIILLSLLAGSYCMTAECYILYEIECGKYDVRQVQRPENIEDLKNFCSTLIPQARCFGKVLENCVHENKTLDNEEDMEEFREMMRFIESSCEEENQVFQAIANNLNCVMSTTDTMDDICFFQRLTETQKEKLSNIIDGHIGCLVENWNHYCMNAKFDVECGNDVRDAVDEILNIFEMSPYCKELRSEKFYLESAFKSEFRRGNYGQAALPGIFEAIIKEED